MVLFTVGLSVNEMHFRTYLLLFVFVLCTSFGRTRAQVEQFESTPTMTRGLYIGDLSMMQFLYAALIFLLMTMLYSMGILPFVIQVEWIIDKFYPLPEEDSARGRSLSAYYQTYDTYARKGVAVGPVLWECSLQFVCDVEFWAHRDHDTFLENTLARWFKYTGNGYFVGARTSSHLPNTCPDMYRCPFNVQEAVGIRIPGSSSNSIADIGTSDYDDFWSM